MTKYTKLHRNNFLSIQDINFKCFVAVILVTAKSTSPVKKSHFNTSKKTHFLEPNLTWVIPEKNGQLNRNKY